MLVLSLVSVGIALHLVPPLILFRALYPLIYELYLFYIAPLINRSNDPRKEFGAWAVITGGTDGIGKGYAYALAAKGMNILLIARNPDKLQKVRIELLSHAQDVLNKSISVEVLTLDFSNPPTVDGISSLEDRLSKLEGGVGVLINNVGMLPHFLETFQSVYVKSASGPSPPDNIDGATAFCRVNCMSGIEMCLAALPVMIKQKKGIIVNVSSISALTPQSGYVIYGATKAFVHNFSRALKQDLKSDKQTGNIKIQTVAPGCVQTNMLPEAFNPKTAFGRFFIPDYQTWANWATDTIGRVSETNGCIGHRLIAYLLVTSRILPVCLQDRLSIFHAERLRAFVASDKKNL